MGSKEQLYDQLAELARIEEAPTQDRETLQRVWSEQVRIYQELLQLNCNQLPSDSRSVVERLQEKNALLRKGTKSMPVL